jgi:hypothetical protein
MDGNSLRLETYRTLTKAVSFWLTAHDESYG